MASVTLKLKDGTNTLDFSDTSKHAALPNSFQIGPIQQLRGLSGDSFFRNGAIMTQHGLGTRTVRVALIFNGDDAGTLQSNIQSVNKMLQQNRNRSVVVGSGTPLELETQLGTSANEEVDFRVIDGQLTLRRNTFDQPIAKNFRTFADLNLLVDPLGVGASEELSNYLNNPSFENGTLMVGWTENSTATGTSTRDATRGVYGTASMKVTMTGASGGLTHEAQYQDVAVTASEVYSVSVYTEAVTLGSIGAVPSQAVMKVQSLLGTTVLYEDEDYLDVTTTGTAHQLSRTNIRIPAGATTLRVWGMVRASTASATGTAYYDGFMAASGTSIPNAYITGRVTNNEIDTLLGTGINHFDVFDIPGDAQAKMRLTMKSLAASGTNRVYIALRGGDRMTDNLLTQGESATVLGVFYTASSTVLVNSIETSNIALATASYGTVGRTRYRGKSGAGNHVTTSTNYGYWEWNLGGTAPKGLFRVLVMSEYTATTNGAGAGLATAFSNATAAGTNFRLGIGYSVGSLSWTPRVGVASDYAHYGTALRATMNLIDVGEVQIPPGQLSDQDSYDSYKLQLYYGIGTTVTWEGAASTRDMFEWHSDYIMLLPVDEGAAIIGGVGSSDQILLDSVSQKPGVYFLTTTGSVNNVPDRTGGAFQIGPEPLRVYILRDDKGNPSAVSYTSTLVFHPQYNIV
jgi:hypothetical protein